ncbi:MAG: CDP-glycerol glycerophosphotransferase family protein [Gaiellaceae bacterium]
MSRDPEPPARRVWLLLVDPLPSRVFFDCGIVDRLSRALPERLALIFLVHEPDVGPWRERAAGLPELDPATLSPLRVGPARRIWRRVDMALDRKVGFFPLAVRHSLRHGFHQGRWKAGHSNRFLDPTFAGRLPRWERLDRALVRWHFSRARYVPDVLLERMRAECTGIVVTNLQAHSSVPFLNAAHRLGVPVVGYVASWDHVVGKGVVSPHLDRYVVQNETMRDDLVRYHGIDPDRVVITGWPQSDSFSRRRPRAVYESLLTELSLDPGRPVVLVAGNSPANSPYEGKLVQRLVEWWREGGAQERFSLLFRPHPRDREYLKRFASVRDQPGAALMEPSYTDLEQLATLLQHVDCVVTNAGTVLLDSLVNERPAVCVAYDEGAPTGERFAPLSLEGKHYRDLAASGAFYRAEDFAGLVQGVERALARPGELAEQRRRIVAAEVGEVDGRAAERVSTAILEVVSP